MPGHKRDTARSGDRLYRAAEVIAGSGISRQMFYNYLAIGLIQPQGSTPGGRNRYGEAVFKRIDLIRRLNRSGYTLRDIREVFMRGDRA
jgi:DNA-binding transcriptional MerR regulator